jgi:hypothetical protein
MSIANYKEHRQAFNNLLQADCDKPILLFKGKVGIGKSTLVEYCCDSVTNTHYAYFNFKNHTKNIQQVFYTLAENLKLENVDDFLEIIPSVNIGGNTQAGVGNVINVELNQNILIQRAEYHTKLTKRLVKEANRFQDPFIIFIDTYEKANTEIQSWIKGDLLNCVKIENKLRVVIAGQNVPEISHEWKRYSILKELHGVHEAEEWLPVIDAKRKKSPPSEFLKSFCAFANGNPSKMLEYIEAFPEKDD